MLKLSHFFCLFLAILSTYASGASADTSASFTGLKVNDQIMYIKHQSRQYPPQFLLAKIVAIPDIGKVTVEDLNNKSRFFLEASDIIREVPQLKDLSVKQAVVYDFGIKFHRETLLGLSPAGGFNYHDWGRVTIERIYENGYFLIKKSNGETLFAERSKLHPVSDIKGEIRAGQTITYSYPPAFGSYPANRSADISGTIAAVVGDSKVIVRVGRKGEERLIPISYIGR